MNFPQSWAQGKDAGEYLTLGFDPNECAILIRLPREQLEAVRRAAAAEPARHPTDPSERPWIEPNGPGRVTGRPADRFGYDGSLARLRRYADGSTVFSAPWPGLATGYASLARTLGLIARTASPELASGPAPKPQQLAWSLDFDGQLRPSLLARPAPTLLRVVAVIGQRFRGPVGAALDAAAGALGLLPMPDGKLDLAIEGRDRLVFRVGARVLLAEDPASGNAVGPCYLLAGDPGPRSIPEALVCLAGLGRLCDLARA